MRNRAPCRPDCCQQDVDSFAADPGLNSKPATGYERAQDCCDVRAQHSERCARKHRERNSVASSGVRVQQHGNQDNAVPEKDREHGLLPVHPALNQARGKHVGEDIHRHRDPEGSVVVGAPGSGSTMARSSFSGSDGGG